MLPNYSIFSKRCFLIVYERRISAVEGQQLLMSAAFHNEAFF